MANVGDRVEVTTKSGLRAGVVTRASGTMLGLRWDTGEETVIVPAAGVLRVVASGAKRPTRARAGTKKSTPVKASASAKKAAKKSPAPAKAAKATKTPEPKDKKSKKAKKGKGDKKKR